MRECKGFSAFVQFYASTNSNRYLQLLSFGGQYHYDNVYNVASYWSPTNPNGASPIPRYASTLPYYGTNYLYDGSYLRLKNAEVSYTFKTSQLKRVGINAFRVYSKLLHLPEQGFKDNHTFWKCFRRYSSTTNGRFFC